MGQSIPYDNNEVFTLWNAIKSWFTVCEAASILRSSNLEAQCFWGTRFALDGWDPCHIPRVI